MLRTLGVPFYARRPRKAVSVYEDYGSKPEEEPIKKVRFESVKPRKKKKKK